MKRTCFNFFFLMAALTLSGLIYFGILKVYETYGPHMLVFMAFCFVIGIVGILGCVVDDD